MDQLLQVKDDYKMAVQQGQTTETHVWSQTIGQLSHGNFRPAD